MATRSATTLDLSSVLDGTRPAVEARLFALAREPAPNPEIAAWVTDVLPRFPFDSWRLAVASRCIGLALLHHAPAEAFALTELPDLPGPARAFRAPALAAALAFHRRQRFGPEPAGQTPEHTELATKTRDALQESWMALAAHRAPTTLPILLEWLNKGPATHVTARLTELISFPRDPKITDAVALVLRAPGVGYKPETPLFLALGLALVAHGGPSRDEALHRLVAEMPALEWLQPLASSGARSRDVEAASAQPAPAERPTIDERWFLAHGAEAPEDLARRSVFADWLLERGDPRGELIALQLAAVERPLTPKERRREGALVKKHARAWLRSLTGLSPMREPVFARGFPVELALELDKKLPEPEAPLLATVERLELMSAGSERARAFLERARLTSLHTLEAWPSVLEHVPPNITGKARTLVSHIEYPIDLERLRRIELPAIEHLVLRYTRESLTDLTSLPWFTRLAGLEVRKLQAPWAWLEAAAETQLRRFGFGFPAQARFVFDLENKALHLEIGEHVEEDALFKLLPSLPATYRVNATFSLAEGVAISEKRLRRSLAPK